MQVSKTILDGGVFERKASLVTFFTMILITALTMAMAASVLSAHFPLFSGPGCGPISSCFLGSLTTHGSLYGLCWVPFDGPDPVDVINLMHGLIHATACIVEVIKENLSTQHFSVFFSIQAMGCFGTLFKTLVALLSCRKWG